jgi:hypothetical protein
VCHDATHGTDLATFDPRRRRRREERETERRERWGFERVQNSLRAPFSNPVPTYIASQKAMAEGGEKAEARPPRRERKGARLEREGSDMP